MSEGEVRELEEADQICRRLLEWDLGDETEKDGGERAELEKVLRGTVSMAE